MPPGQFTDSETLAAANASINRSSNILRRKTSGWLLLVATLAVLLAACGTNVSSGPTADLVSDFPITVYTGADVVGGAEINFSDLRGQPVVLNFWAGLCPPCRAEMPHFQEFYDEYQDQLVLIGVDVGQFTGLGSQDAARNLLDTLEITYPTGFTDDGTVIKEYRVLQMPTTFFITSEGLIFRKYDGLLPAEQLEEITNEMLSQEPG